MLTFSPGENYGKLAEVVGIAIAVLIFGFGVGFCAWEPTGTAALGKLLDDVLNIHRKHMVLNYSQICYI